MAQKKLQMVSKKYCVMTVGVASPIAMVVNAGKIDKIHTKIPLIEESVLILSN